MARCHGYEFSSGVCINLIINFLGGEGCFGCGDAFLLPPVFDELAKLLTPCSTEFFAFALGLVDHSDSPCVVFRRFGGGREDDELGNANHDGLRVRKVIC